MAVRFPGTPTEKASDCVGAWWALRISATGMWTLAECKWAFYTVAVKHHSVSRCKHRACKHKDCKHPCGE